jgi:putative SOS response-associated peptidase YedK
MCGRYSLTDPNLDKLVAARFAALLAFKGWKSRYNAAPTQMLPVILNDVPNRVVLSRWGFVPSWDKKRLLINARGETVASKFRRAFQERRCLVLADGFYEWRRSGTKKLPFRFTLDDGALFAFAGLWEESVSQDGEVMKRFSIITTTPNRLVADVHDRMPVILPPGAEEDWLLGDESRADELVSPFPAEHMECIPVSTRVNSPRNDDPRLLERSEPEAEPPGEIL